MLNRHQRRAAKSQSRKLYKGSNMKKKFVIPAEVSDIDLPMNNGKFWSQTWQIFMREHILSWTNWDESSDMMEIAESIRKKFSGKKEGDAVYLTEEEWEKGKKALEGASIQAIFKPITRSFRLAWLKAESVKTDDQGVVIEETNGAAKVTEA